MENLTQRDAIFKEDVNAFIEYDPKLKEDFYLYWSEPNHKKTKMKWEMEKTWDLSRRLRTWFNNQNKWNANSTTGTTKAKGYSTTGNSGYAGGF